ncbi:MAG: hypothetical protein ACREXS_19630 [Gammaproteobacteria bacterium]
MDFEVIGPIREIQVIAKGRGVRVRKQLAKVHGRGRWRKLKGHATIRLPNGNEHEVELHWYEAHGIGRREVKIKHYLDDV